MATGRIWDPEWLWLNSQRKYPLLDTCTGLDTSGSFTIPDSFLLDMTFPVPATASSDPMKFHVLQLASYASGYIVTIGYDSVAIGVFTVPISTHVNGKVYTIIGVDDYENFTGYVAIGSLNDINTQPGGVWVFAPANAVIQPRCIVPAVEGLVGIRVSSGGALSGVMNNIVIFEEGQNAMLRVDEATRTVYIDAVGSSDYSESCVCDNQRNLGDPIRTINGLHPDANHNFTLVPNDCISLTSIGSGLSIADTCSKPCCGCEELLVVNSALQTLRNQYTTLANYAATIDQLAQATRGVVDSTLVRFPNVD